MQTQQTVPEPEVGDREKAFSALRAQQVVLWSAPVLAAVLVVLFALFPGFWPPMSPDMSAAEVGAFYRDHTAMVQLSQVGFNLFGILVVPFFCLVMVQMQRMRSETHIYAFSYLTSVVGGATLFALSNIFFAVAAYRPGRGDEVIQLLNDLAWMIFIAPVGMLLAQFILLALAILADDPAKPVFPRWVAWYSLATAVAMAPSVGAAVAHDGPLAWDGLVSFWLRNGAFAAFVIVMFFVVRGALQRQADQELAAS